MDPMVGSGHGGKRSHTHIHSVVGGVEEENSNSNVVSLLEVCFLCNRRFLYDLTLDPGTTQDDKEEDVLLHMFFEDTSALDSKSLLQCCTFCKSLCNSLLEAKSALSSLIDEITSLLRKSKKLSSSANYMLSKPRVISKLFQEHPTLANTNSSSSYLGNLSSTIQQIQFDSEFNSNLQFTNSNSVSESKFSHDDDEHRNMMDISHGHHHHLTEISPPPTSTTNFSFLSPSKSILGNFRGKLLLKQDQHLPEISSSKSSSSSTNKRKQQQQQTLSKSASKNDAASSSGTTNTQSSKKMISNANGRFVLLEENARDVEDCDSKNVEDDDNNQVNGSLLLNKQYILRIDNSNCQQTNGKNVLLLDQEKSPIILSYHQEPTFTSAVSSTISYNNSSESKEKVPEEKQTTPPIKGSKSSVGGGKFGCTICSKSFKCNRDLQSHIGSHSQSKPWKCEICDTSYRQKKALEIHVGIHRGESKFACHHCKKVFTQKVSLLRHLPMHTGETVYQCDLCGKGFLHHSSFAHHKLTHSGKRNFACKVCSQYFFTSSHLKRHARTHTGERPYQCGTCHKSFNEKSNLTVHERVHTKIPAFHCSESGCSKGFDRKHKLRTHLETEHSQLLNEKRI